MWQTLHVYSLHSLKLAWVPLHYAIVTAELIHPKIFPGKCIKVIAIHYQCCQATSLQATKYTICGHAFYNCSLKAFIWINALIGIFEAVTGLAALSLGVFSTGFPSFTLKSDSATKLGTQLAPKLVFLTTPSQRSPLPLGFQLQYHGQSPCPRVWGRAAQLTNWLPHLLALTCMTHGINKYNWAWHQETHGVAKKPTRQSQWQNKRKSWCVHQFQVCA